MFNIYDFENAKKLPLDFFAKDINNNYFWCNEHLANTVELDQRDIIGKTDVDILSPINAVDSAHIFRENDQLVMATQKTHCLMEPGVHTATFFSIKQPLYDNNSTLIGVWGLSVNISVINFTDIIMQAAKATAVSKTDLKLPGLHQEYLKIKADNLNLSKREVECLYHLLKGRTAKMIGQALQLSPRTVEKYLENVKAKFGCATKSELIDKALEHGF